MVSSVEFGGLVGAGAGVLVGGSDVMTVGSSVGVTVGGSDVTMGSSVG